MSYNKKTWSNGDLITEESLNNIENGIYHAHDEIVKIDSQINNIKNQIAVTLAIGEDGLLYLADSNGNLLGTGIKLNGTLSSNGVIVFNADFSNTDLSATQFTTWNGRIYDGAIYEIGTCQDGQLHLTSTYDSSNSRWIKQMCNTAGLFESDNFTCEFRAKYDGTPGSWNNVITYGTGTYWTSGMYSDGVKWPAGGEIDAFEQAGGYLENPNIFHTPTVHYGSGTESGYSKTHEVIHGFTSDTTFVPGEFHVYKFTLNNGVVKIYIDDELKQEYDFNDCVVNNNYLYNYKPFIRPQAFYIDGSCSSQADTSNTYEFIIDYFKIYQNKKVQCTDLKIYPQMWGENQTGLIFPTGAEIFMDKIFTPSDVSNKACAWTSNDTSVATVVQGYVKTLKEGTAIITATNNGVSSSYELTVNNTTANVPCVGLYAGNTTIQLDEGTTNDTKTYIYPKFTTDELVITYGTEGIVTYDGSTFTGVSAGTTTVTVTCGSHSITFNATVNAVSLDPILSYTFSPTSVQTGVTVTNQGTLGSAYDLNVNYVKIYAEYEDISVTTPTALTIPTRTAGESYIIIMDLYDVVDRTVQGLLQGQSQMYFTETENTGSMPNIRASHSNVSTGGVWQYVWNGKPNGVGVNQPCRVALWRDNTGQCYIYTSNDSSETIISKSSADTYIKDIVKIKMVTMRITKLDIYYCNMSTDKVKALVDSYNS